MTLLMPTTRHACMLVLTLVVSMVKLCLVKYAFVLIYQSRLDIKVSVSVIFAYICANELG